MAYTTCPICLIQNWRYTEFYLCLRVLESKLHRQSLCLKSRKASYESRGCGEHVRKRICRGIKIADDVELAGIVGRGSKRSAALAASYGVPLYQGANAVPANIDLACVVVRSAMVGGDGVEISRSFLEKGIHVIQEQPMHSSEVLELTRCAAEHDCKFMLNGFYPYLDSVKRFIDAAASLRKEHELLSIDVTTCVQVAYPFVEVVGKVAGSLHPFRLEKIADAGPFDILVGEVGGVPLSVRFQNEMDSSDPDNNAIA